MPRAAKKPATTISETATAEDVNRALVVIGGKWTVQIITSLLGGTKRFGALMVAMGGVSPKMLISRLRDLEEQGFVTRTLYPEIPPRVEYALTAQGQTLAPMITAIANWGATHGQTLGIKRSQRGTA